MPMLENHTQKIADSVILQAVARISMALSLPALGLVAGLFNANLEQKFEAQDKSIIAQQEASEQQSMATTARVVTVERVAQSAVEQASKVNERLISVETKQTQESAAAERFQTATLSRLDRLQDSVVSLSNAIAALTATMQATQQQSRSKSPQD